ncbi:MAG: RdgB/HAM1 family non-canonical purine NTP pyrophosphatase [Parvibaculum sp.]|nr:RdgB/HAM1 family non-canonical purine NTP pyrophosphatase [Parvibaculum sp.]
MSRKFDAKDLIIASHNEGKVREFRDLFAGLPFRVRSAAELGLREPDETGDTFRANAELKALAAAKAANEVALADDSGLCVEALNGQPGIYSARWAGPKKDFDFAMEKVRLGLVEEGTLNTRAYFIAGLALAWPDGHVEYFEGRIDGDLVWPPRGLKGFGYDPMFVPDGHDMTFGEMEPAKKHAMSHRAKAFSQLINACFRG